MRRDQYFTDTGSLSNFFHGNDGFFAKNMMLSANGSPIIEIISAIRPQSTLNDMMRIHRRVFAENTLMAVPFKNRVSKIIPATPFLVIVRGIMLKGNGFSELWLPGLQLLIIGLILIRITIQRFTLKLK